MRFVAAVCVALLTSSQLLACTSAVIAGKATHDGRPILWKQRDTGTLENKLVFHAAQSAGPYAFLGVHNLDDTINAEMYMGSNAAGFAIMNTQSYNLEYPRYRGKMDEEGIVMKKALATCATLADFEALLRETSGKRGVEANFGVIDASGGAAYYETDPYAFTKYDANDPSVAPHGYLLRTNFSVSGTSDKGLGNIRYQTECDLFAQAFSGEGLTVNFILKDATACLRQSLTRVDLARGPLPESAEEPSFVSFADFIPRHSTAASLIIEGVAPGEDPSLTTLWLVLGFPLTTPVLPLWVKYADVVPGQLFARNGHPSAINDASLKLKSQCFPLKIAEGKSYIDLAKIMNRRGTGSLQRLQSVDAALVQEGRRLLENMRAGKTTPADVQTAYREMLRKVEAYYAQFGLKL
jgi:hypothetical protein